MTSKYKSAVVPSFKDLRNRPYPIDSEELPISDDSVLRDVQKYLSTHSNKSIGTLVGYLTKIFYLIKNPRRIDYSTKLFRSAYIDQ